MCYGLGDYKSPGLIGRTFFTTDFKSVGTPNGGVGRLAGVEFSGHKKSRGILEGESPRQLKSQRPV